MRLVCAVLSGLSLCLLGCSLTSTAPPVNYPGATLTGVVHGGQQPIVGASIYLYAASTSGYGAASTSLLNSNVLTNNPLNSGKDSSNRYYVTSDSSGNYSITGDYTCTAGQEVYLYAVGGNPGIGSSNPSASLMAVLGDCPGPSFSSSLSIIIDEVTTVAAAYSMAGFATDATHVSSSGTALAVQGVANAFANAANLANLASGNAQLSIASGYGLAPQKTVNTLADILATCVNSNGAVTGPTTPTSCYTVFNNAPNGSTIPSETATAAINIAHNPGANVSNLFGSPTPTGPFTPTLSNAPIDFTLGIQWTGGGIDVPENLAVDGLGDVWVVNSVNSISVLGPTGVPISPSTGGFYGIGGYTTGISGPYGVAIDTGNNAWITEPNYASLTKYSNTGTPAFVSTYSTGSSTRPTYVTLDPSGSIWMTNAPGSGTAGVLEMPAGGGAASSYTGGGISGPYGLASDASGNIWVANNTTGTVSEFTNAGVPYAASPFAAGGQYSYPHGIAIGLSGNVWVPAYSDTITLLNQAGGNVVSGGTPQAGGLNDPYYTAVDGAGNAWIVNAASPSVSEFSPAGAAISGAQGYATGSLNAGSSSSATGIAVDGSGNVWVADTNGNNVVELVGAGVPAITPIALTVKNNTIGTKP